MTEHKQTKSCLVVSYGPVPTPQYQTIEGGGMRAWGLAQGLQENGIEVTVAVNASFPQELTSHEGIHLATWSPDEKFADLINSFDAVVVSYCMGSDSVFIADNINPEVQLILDMYVPIYVEVSARDSEDIDKEYVNYQADIKRFNHVLKRGDYFLCASQPQKIFYTGVLGALGIINPRSYRQNRILVVPFGIHDLPVKATENPYSKLGITKNDFVVLWFGGLYPWFRIEEMLGAMQALSQEPNIKFVFVGGKNPFNPNPDFFRQYEKAVSFSQEKGLIDKSVFFVDWVDFDTRINWFVNADLVISLNNPGEENSFSWRTRVMDFVWGEVPILTNGEDVLSEELLAKHAAVRLPELSAHAITNSIKELSGNPKFLEETIKNIRTVKKTYFWHEVVKPLGEILMQGEHPNMEEAVYNHKLEQAGMQEGEHASTLNRSIVLLKKGLRHAQRHGVKSAVALAKKKLARHTPLVPAKKHSKQYVFISHPINNSGAPLVLLQIINEAIEKYGGENVRIIAPHIDPAHLRRLREAGVKIEQATPEASESTIRQQLDLKKHDFVFLNTVAVSENYQNFVISNLEHGKLAKAHWFIHEDQSQLPLMQSTLLNKKFVERALGLIENKKLRIFVPSERVRKDYNKILGTQKVKTIPYRVDVPDELKSKRSVKDYSKLRFLLSGGAADGRKCQFVALAAFNAFLKDYYEKNPKQYRDFELNLIAIGDDYVSQQIKTLGRDMLGSKHLVTYPLIPPKKALEITRDCNAVICCSLNETFAIYVAEGMFMGHVVLRNGSAGMEEQLQDGKNGYYIDEKDMNQFASVLEKLLNKKNTSDEQLQKMGETSQKIIAPFATNKYLEKIEGEDK